MKVLLQEIRACTLCTDHLPLGPKPVLSVSPNSRIVIIGQAPGSVVAQTGIPWDDQSGNNLRKWLNVDKDAFYNPDLFALIPMGFCYPGKSKSGDLPPRKECAPLWHHQLFKKMADAKLTLLIGKYAQDYYLSNYAKSSLTKTVQNFEEYLPKFFVLPHPSPRNNIWQAKNPWFINEVIPNLQNRVKEII